MDAKQKLLVRNIVGGIILLVLVVLVLAYCGVFEGKQSDEAQVRALLERSRDEINDHDWDDLFNLCDLTEPEKQAWIDAVPNQARLVQVDSIQPQGMISVPTGATDYEIDVTVIAHLEAPIVGKIGNQMDSVSCHMRFVKKHDRWFIDPNNSTFPAYVNKPKMPR
jgi:hypothetical protein